MRPYTAKQKRDAKKALAELPVVDNHKQRRDVTNKEGNTAHYGLEQPPADATWSGSLMPVPAIGDRVHVTFNEFGVGTVRDNAEAEDKRLLWDGRNNHAVTMVGKVNGGWLVRMPDGTIVGPVPEAPEHGPINGPALR